MITVTTEPHRKLIKAQMSGLLTVEEVQAFSVEEQRAAASMRAGSGQFDLLVEAIGTVVQTQEVMATFADLIVQSPLKARKIAVVREGALTSMQVKRVSRLRSNHEVFGTMAEAEAWLREP
jgi:uncharacterized protein (DUF2384 family)